MTVILTQNQIETFADALVKAGLIEKSDLEANKHIIEEALKLSARKEGLAQVMYNYTEPTGSEMQETPAISAYNGQVLTRAIHEPIEIFSILYACKRNELKEKQQQQNKLLDDALKDWYYYDEKTPANSRYNAALGRYVTKEYFIEFPYKCAWQAAGCMQRFKTPEDAQRHRYRHGG